MPAITVLRNPRNMGKGYSIRNGILNSTGQLHHLHRRRHGVLEGQPAVGARETRKRRSLRGREPPLAGFVYIVNNALVKYVYRRHRGGIAFNTLVRLLFGLTTRDTQSGLKGFSRSAAARIFQQLYTDGFLFDIEIFIRSRARLAFRSPRFPCS